MEGIAFRMEHLLKAIKEIWMAKKNEQGRLSLLRNPFSPEATNCRRAIRAGLNT